MIDTVKIKLKRGNGQIKEYGNFSPEFSKRTFRDLSDNEKYSQNNFIKKFVSKSNLLDGDYAPRVEIYEKLDRKNKIVFRDVLVEFSVPKIIFSNNLEELSENDFDTVLATLQDKLFRMGIVVRADTLSDAVVSKVHFGKNIPLPNKYSVKDVIDEFRNTEMGKSTDVTERRLKNRDEIFHLYNGSRDSVLYDKSRDMQNPRGRSADKNKTSYEKEMVEVYNLENKEILRYEYRINNYNSVKSEVNKNLKRGYENNITFSDLFDDNLWKDIIFNSWNKILDRPENQLAFRFNKNKIENVVRALFLNCSKGNQKVHSQNLAFSSFGLAYLANEFGMKFIKKECERYWSKEACGERLREKTRNAVKKMGDLKYPESIVFVDNELKKFQKITKETLEKML